MNTSGRRLVVFAAVAGVLLLSAIIDASRYAKHENLPGRLEASTPADEARRREEVLWRVRATLENITLFDYDRSAIRDDTRGSLEAKLTLLRADSTIRLRVEGHADERGSEAYNYTLALARANAVREFLIAGGVEPDRIEVRSFGKNVPRDPRHNELAWAQNRRTEFRVLAGQSVTGRGR